MAAAYSTPPWDMFPGIQIWVREPPPPGLIEYGDQWCRYFFSLSSEGRDAYQEFHPEPIGWRGFYESIRGSE